jgi:putative ABC transport system permease protein
VFGLLGLVMFTAERKTREIGIRKILGSSNWGIVCFLSADFTKMVLTAIVIALPIGYWASK